ncbi:hypothetical protein C8J56DRAFT_253133 [Mycena floridula]|nr:hypothetical protein C8J56DRAFT_253133 [Mycena floridula]
MVRFAYSCCFCVSLNGATGYLVDPYAAGIPSVDQDSANAFDDNSSLRRFQRVHQSLGRFRQAEILDLFIRQNLVPVVSVFSSSITISMISRAVPCLSQRHSSSPRFHSFGAFCRPVTG